MFCRLLIIPEAARLERSTWHGIYEYRRHQSRAIAGCLGVGLVLIAALFPPCTALHYAMVCGILVSGGGLYRIDARAVVRSPAPRNSQEKKHEHCCFRSERRRFTSSYIAGRWCPEGKTSQPIVNPAMVRRCDLPYSTAAMWIAPRRTRIAPGSSGAKCGGRPCAAALSLQDPLEEKCPRIRPILTARTARSSKTR